MSNVNEKTEVLELITRFHYRFAAIVEPASTFVAVIQQF